MFDGDTPNHSLAPKNYSFSTCLDLKKRAASDCDIFIRFEYASVTELRPDGSVVRAVNLTESDWIIFQPRIPSGQKKKLFFYANLDKEINGSGRVLLDFAGYRNETNITFAGATYTLRPQSVKWNMRIEGWKFESTANSLQADLSLFAPTNNPILAALSNETIDLQSFIFETPSTTIVVDMPTRVIVDNETIQSIPAPQLIGFSFIRVIIPWFNQSVSYDPSASLLLGGSGSDGGDGGGLIDGDGNGGDDTTVMIVLIAVLVPLAVVGVIAIGAAVGVTTWLVHKKKRAAQEAKFRNLSGGLGHEL